MPKPQVLLLYYASMRLPVGFSRELSVCIQNQFFLSFFGGYWTLGCLNC